MKKTIFLSAVMMALTSFTFSQTLTWNNRDSFIPDGSLEVTFEQGQTIDLDLTYESGADRDFFYIGTFIRELDNMGNVVAGSDSPFITLVGDTADNNDENVMVQYTIPADATLTADLAPRHSIQYVLFMSSRPDANSDVDQAFDDENTIATIVAQGTLSTNSFASTSLTDFGPNPTTGIVNFGSAIHTKTYSVYGNTGQLIREVPATGRLDISDLASGLYFVATEQGMAKVIKE